MDTDTLFLEPRLPDFEALLEDESVLPEPMEISLEDLPLILPDEPNFTAVCASVKMVNSFLDAYEVSRADRSNLIKGVMTMVHETARNIISVKDKEFAASLSQKAEGKNEKEEYYGTYL